jgi:3,4-dihydroxyphenylacetaldehyde synthase
LGKLLDLPKVFLNCSEGNGGGVIQGSASESILVALLAARETTVRRVQVEHPDWTESDIRGKLVAYTSDHSNSCVEKSGILGAMEMRLIPGDDDCQLRGDALMQAIQEDIKRGKIPCICISTLGTTGTCAYDRLDELGPICNENKVWLHIDAAYAGAAFCCPEYRYVMNGMEMADSFNFNLHKWMRVNFDCCAMWFKNAGHVTQAFNVDRIYLKHQFQGQSAAPDYRHWQIPLGRRFRALKVWITLRSYGAEKIRDFIRSHIGMAERFERFLKTDSRFEVVQSAQMALVCFRLKGDCTKSKKLLEMITERKNIYMIPATARGKFVIRYVVCGFDPKLSDVDFAWNEIKSQTDLLLGVTNMQPAIIGSEIMHSKDKEVEKITRRFSSDVTTGAAEKNK